MSRLAEWYLAHGRHDLPWRATRDPWAVLVSEVMLQQTQVTRILEAWPEFIAVFPDAATMAAATPGAVISAWGRLGYPRRARRLHDAAHSCHRGRCHPEHRHAHHGLAVGLIPSGGCQDHARHGRRGARTDVLAGIVEFAIFEIIENRHPALPERASMDYFPEGRGVEQRSGCGLTFSSILVEVHYG